jgi:hypothetical protein
MKPVFAIGTRQESWYELHCVEEMRDSIQIKGEARTKTPELYHKQVERQR